MNIWIVGVGLLLLGLMAPVVGNISSSVVPLYSDPVSIIIIFAMPAVIVFLWVWAAISGD